MNNQLIQCKKLQKSYGDLKVINDLELTIYDGEFLTLLGPSGCGKTTLLRLLAGFELADSGQIILDSRDISLMPPEKRPFNTVFQSYALFPHLNVFDNVAFGLRIQNLPELEIKNRVNEALKLVNLSDFGPRRCNQLSGGQSQRVAIARAIVTRPKLLLLDESLSALDLKLRKQMQVELKHLQREMGITFVFVTHDQEEALSMSDRIILLNQGSIEQQGSPKEIYEDPKTLFAAKFIGETTIFEGHINAIDNEDCLNVEVMNQVVKLSGYQHKINQGVLGPNQDVQVIVRPEDLRVERDYEDLQSQFYWRGKVKDILYRGTVIDLHIHLENGQNIIATEFYNEDSDALEYESEIEVFICWVPGWEVILRK